MGKTTGFLEFQRTLPTRRPVQQRVQDYYEIYERFPHEKVQEQGARCMDCGIPFCTSGCPLGNMIPDFNDFVYRGDWEGAWHRLRATNNFPEFTGRICPAPCESACVLGYVDEPVTIEYIEQTIAEKAWASGFVQPNPPVVRTGKAIAVVGSGPAGLAAADQLNRAGHHVTVLERDDAIGGLLRYGIPDFKLEKRVLDRRLQLMEAEGVSFVTNAHVGETWPVENLDAFDAVVLCGGATRARDLRLPGRELDGIHFAGTYLSQQNRRVAGKAVEVDAISAEGKHVIVIGGGDTGSDCIGTANRQGAASITQFEIMPMPDDNRPADQPWPHYPMILRTTTSHEEGASRHWQILTQQFNGENGRVTALQTVEVEQTTQGFTQVEGSEQVWPADLVLLAIGYTGPEASLPNQLGLKLDARGNIETNTRYATSKDGVFAAGDARRGQSLVVWAISEGREAAHHIDAWLMGYSSLPTKGDGDLAYG